MYHLDALRRERPRTTSFVLVAVDSPTDGVDAVAWAAAEASARQATLHILHVIPWEPFGLDYVGQGDAGAYDAAQRLPDKAAERARRVAPHVAITTRIHTGEPARAIALEGDRADLIVLGRGATCHPRRRSRRSVTLQVAARSQRPVAVVGDAGTPQPGSAAGRVVAVMPSDHDPARGMGCPGSCLQRCSPAWDRSHCGCRRARRATAGGTTVDDLVRQHMYVFFDIDLQRQPLTGPRGSLLTHASRSAALVVFAVPESRVARWRCRSAIGRLLQTIPALITFVHHRPSPLLHRTSPLGGPR
ncbi:universal stress protein [Kribbella turkmenica]|uniref:Universal stress protein n=1 Tax=Kribbella turkmenica TaxID=2530375 RepID=A0A4R4XFU8_9ACTN|nr:universal stress protein [Kribbella turkmenica]